MYNDIMMCVPRTSLQEFITICNSKYKVIICYATFLYKHSAVEDDEASAAYSRLIVGDLTVRHPLLVVGPVQSAAWPIVLAALVSLSSVPYYSLFLQTIVSLIKYFTTYIKLYQPNARKLPL